MIRKVPIIDSPVGPSDIVYALSRSADRFAVPELETIMSGHTGCRYIHTVDSGIAALYIILKALSAVSAKTEVILPAYTAGSLVVAVRRAGLSPVLCDISFRDFNCDADAILRTVSDRTLAVVCVHMFGVEMAGIKDLKARLPAGVTLVEDCAQAMGSSIGGAPVGSFGDVSFFSFNRGKNLAACGGGCIATNIGGMSESISRVKSRMGMARGRSEIMSLLKLAAFAAAVNPYVYGALFGLISRFKDTAPPLDFEIAEMSFFDAALTVKLFRRFGAMSEKRHANGIFLTKALKDMTGLTLPSVSGPGKTIFNRFPVVFKDCRARDRAMRAIWRSGVESSRMYLRPLHHMFDLGYRREDFPNACALAQGILTLPVHPSVGSKDLARSVEAVRESLRWG
jgi:dTDP-4-amino-4,6-dideoxygalactose transaminase